MHSLITPGSSSPDQPVALPPRPCWFGVASQWYNKVCFVHAVENRRSGEVYLEGELERGIVPAQSVWTHGGGAGEDGCLLLLQKMNLELLQRCVFTPALASVASSKLQLSIHQGCACKYGKMSCA